MNFNFTRFILIALVILFIDWYSFQAIKVLTNQWQSNFKGILGILFWIVPIIAIFLSLAPSLNIPPEIYKFFRTWVFPLVMLLYISKIVILPFVLVDDLVRLTRFTVQKVSNNPEELKISRSTFLAGLGLIIAGIPFFTLLIGMLRGPYKFQVRKVALKFPHLPKVFSGLKIVQISDFHLGSWKNTEVVEKAVKRIMAQNADIILFTGDLVNDLASEVVPYLELLKGIKAPMGVYSTLGNHDYGDYTQWDSPEAKQKNLQTLMDYHALVGWNLMNDTHIRMGTGNESFVLAGVQNWGAKGNFPKKGNLNKALLGTSLEDFIILMSHDPSHWKAEILSHPSSVDLTLAGHTHGMQYGADLGWLKWSPVQWMYREWMDLYNEGKQLLYVNRGIGFIGYPGRFGIDPEITVFTIGS